MRPNLRLVLLFPPVLLLAVAPAFAEIYRHRDANGNVVFTDQPPEDAEAVELGPVNTVPGAPAAQKTPAPATTPALAYGRLEITGIRNDDVLRNPDAPLLVRATPDVPLQSGHQLVYLRNGQVLDTRNSPVLIIDGPALERGSHTFTAEIRDAEGQVLIASEPLTLHVHRTTVPPARVRPR